MFQLSPWTKVSLDQCLLGQKSSQTNVPWTKWSLDNCPLDKCRNTLFQNRFSFLNHHIHLLSLIFKFRENFTFNKIVQFELIGGQGAFLHCILMEDPANMVINEPNTVPREENSISFPGGPALIWSSVATLQRLHTQFCPQAQS